MGNTDKTAGGTTQLPALNSNQVICLEKIIDFASTGLASGSTFDVFNIPAYTFVLGVFAEVLTAEGGTATIDVGASVANTADADGFLDGIDINAAAGTKYSSAPGVATTGSPCTWATVFGNGYWFTAADTVRVLANNTLDAAKVRFKMLAFQP